GEGVRMFADDLQSSSAIRMNHRGNALPRVGLGTRCEHHVVVGVVVVIRSPVREIEPAFGGLQRHHRCEWPDRLAVFYAFVEHVAGAWIAGIRNDGTVPERARSCLRSSL